MKKILVLVSLVLVMVTVGFLIMRNRSQAKSVLRDIKLSAAQNEALAEADKVIEQAEIQQRSALAQRQSLTVGFAISLDIKRDELQKFKLEKRPDGFYHLIELTPEEIQKNSEVQQQQ